MQGAGGLTQESVDFQHKISERNGLGNKTYAPPALHRDPIENNLASAMEEAKMVLFGAVEEVLARTGTHVHMHWYQLSLTAQSQRQANVKDDNKHLVNVRESEKGSWGAI